MHNVTACYQEVAVLNLFIAEKVLWCFEVCLFEKFKIELYEHDFATSEAFEVYMQSKGIFPPPRF